MGLRFFYLKIKSKAPVFVNIHCVQTTATHSDLSHTAFTQIGVSLFRLTGDSRGQKFVSVQTWSSGTVVSCLWGLSIFVLCLVYTAFYCIGWLYTFCLNVSVTVIMAGGPHVFMMTALLFQIILNGIFGFLRQISNVD